ncbi:MAG: hypothetical protein ACTHNW_07700 [Mucilaginibacter sp.]
MPVLSFALVKEKRSIFSRYKLSLPIVYTILPDTTSKKHQADEKKKIKEIARAKRQPKPEKVEDATDASAQKPKPKRERRPEGLERPPEIPRRNGGG